MATEIEATTPDIGDEDDIESQVIRTSVTRKANTKIIRKTRYIKLFNTFIFLISVIFILLFATEYSTGFHLVAYVIALIYLIGGIYFLSIILGSHSLHQIVVRRQSIISPITRKQSNRCLPLRPHLARMRIIYFAAVRMLQLALHFLPSLSTSLRMICRGMISLRPFSCYAVYLAMESMEHGSSKWPAVTIYYRPACIILVRR